MKEAAATAIKGTLNNYSVDKKKIVVKKVYFGDENIDKKLSWGSIQKEKSKNGTLAIPIYANIEIRDGKKVVSRDSKLNIGQLPVPTPHNSVLIDGIEYIVPFQLRRDPGIYTSQSANGTWISSINSAKGRNFKVESQPVTNIQKIEIEGTRIPLLPVLHKFGFSKDQIIKSWGGDADAKKIYANNDEASKTATGKKAVQTLYKKLIFNSNPKASEKEMLNDIHDYMLNKSEFKPHVNSITLGHPHETLSPKAFLDISKRLVVASKNDNPDDTENLMFKHVRTAEDLVKERIQQDFKKKLTASLTRNLKNFKHVKDIVKPGMFTKSIKGFFNKSDISEPSEMINPLHMLSTGSKVTLKGEGGITDVHTVSMDMKSLHPSHMGYLDPLHTPDGSAGLVNHFAIGVSVDRNSQKPRTLYFDKTGKLKLVTVTDAWFKKVATADQYNIEVGKKPQAKSSRIKVRFKGEDIVVAPNQVDLILKHPSQLYDLSTNMVPFINSNSGNRISMAGKMGEQAISLVDREAPLVSTASSNGQEFIKVIGKSTTITAPATGKITKITPTSIEIRKSNGKVVKVDLRNHMELNQESFFHDEPIVKIGDHVKAGDMLTKNNWTDNKGRLSLGINAKIAYMPYQGFSIEDGIVAREGFAKKLVSQHIHVEEVNIKEGGLNLEKFKSNFRNKYQPEAFSKLDSTGVVKKGSTVEKGNLLVAYAKPFIISEEDKVLGKAMRGFKNRLIDQSIIWNYDFPGTIVDVAKSGNLIKVKVKSFQAAELTDKLANRYGGKGVISKIVPDGEMPRTQSGEPLDLILNPHGVQNRNNVGQLFETALGKVAEKTGKRYLLENFKHPNNWEFVTGELKKAGFHESGTEKIIDPTTGKELKSWNPVTKKYEDPFVGVSYFQKLVHQTRKKFDARGRGAYSLIDMPGKDPEASHYIGDNASKENPKSVDRLTLYSLLAHGAKDVVNDMWNNKGQNRQDVWDAIVSGTPLPPPKVSTATKKFYDMLKAAGINHERKGIFGIFPPLTDTDTIEMSAGKIPKPNLFLRGKDLMPIKGGMFDPSLTGGSHNSDISNHIDLGFKVPNPITRNAVKSILNISSDDDFDQILAGKKTVDGLTGPDFFEKKLEAINLNKEIEKIEAEKKTSGKSKLNNLNRRLRYLRAIKTYGLKPIDYMISKVPVIPTKFRPIIPLPNGTIEPAPINHLYRDIAIASKLANDKSLPKFLKREGMAEAYNAISKMQGVTEPITNDASKTVRSVMTDLAGAGSPKGGFIHSKLLSKTQDYIGNSVIGVGPDLGIDEIGIPFRMAEQMYEPFILRELKRLGYKITEYKNIKQKNPSLIKNILEKIVKERPVVVNRNPSLHKGSTFGFNPKLIEGNSLKLNPLILKPFGADFDGDQMPIHVPISQKAVEQVKTMIPSLNVLAPKNDTFQIAFDQEYVAGLALMSGEGKTTNLSFKTMQEAKDAYDKNRIRINDKIKIGGRTTTLGRSELISVMPPEIGYDGKTQLNKKMLEAMFRKLADKGSVSKYTDTINKLKNLGAKYAYDEAFSFGLTDIKPRPDLRIKFLNPAIPKILRGKGFDTQALLEATGKAQDQLDKDFRKNHTRFYLPAIYGSGKAGKDTMMQITTTPFFVGGLKGPVKNPITKSYSEGLDAMDAFNASYGARRAIVDKVQSVSEPGALSKELVASFSGEVITMKDCGTHEGVPVQINDTFNLQNRILAQSINGVPAGTILDKYGLNALRKGKEKTVVVRSPLTCLAPKGVCSMCYGLNEHHALPRIGDPIGLKAAHSIGETGTQSALSSHHLGGTVSAGSFRTGFQQTKFLLHMPEEVKNKATLVVNSGTIKKIEKGIGSQHIVYISNNDEPFICRNKLLIKTGDKVSAGQPLDEGIVKLQELADLAPMRKVQDHMTKELEKSYGATKILRRNTETIVRAVTGYGRIINPGKSPYLEEEIVPINLINWIKNGNPIDVADVIGWELKKGYDKYPSGTYITFDVANDLIKKGIKQVVVNAGDLEVANKLMGINTIPLHQPDLLKKLSFQRIKQALKEGPISGAYTNYHGRFPEPALIMGTEFGMPGFDYY